MIGLRDFLQRLSVTVLQETINHCIMVYKPRIVIMVTGRHQYDQFSLQITAPVCDVRPRGLGHKAKIFGLGFKVLGIEARGLSTQGLAVSGLVLCGFVK